MFLYVICVCACVGLHQFKHRATVYVCCHDCNLLDKQLLSRSVADIVFVGLHTCSQISWILLCMGTLWVGWQKGNRPPTPIHECTAPAQALRGL